MAGNNLFGTDLFGEPVKTKITGPVAEKFLVPPFTVLDARSRSWQDRKRAWVRLGIQGELGRDGLGDTCVTPMSYFNKGKTISGDAGSIFDPLLCELAYRWFCPKGGQVVDSFAGGSVRGIVATLLGYKYWGCDLRQKQITANYEQASTICPETDVETKNGLVKVNVSGKMLRQKFHPCEENFIKEVCKGRCCQGTDKIVVTVHPSEEEWITKLGAEVKDGLIVADKRGLCPFKSDDGLCTIHGDDKPFGCKASPFTLNKNDTLIVRNRYRMLKCYKCEGSAPAYEAHQWSLEQIFGVDETARIVSLVQQGDDKIPAFIPLDHYNMLRENDNIKHGRSVQNTSKNLNWVCGDSAVELDKAPKADFIFSCPPYGNLEKYSDDPNDISNMSHEDFIEVYRTIIKKSIDTLKDNRFACFVVGDFRGKDGYYKNFVANTIEAFVDAGAPLYNEAILVTPTGSASIRVTKQFNSGRKLCKLHQNVLVFCKGDPKKAAKACIG